MAIFGQIVAETNFAKLLENCQIIIYLVSYTVKNIALV